MKARSGFSSIRLTGSFLWLRPRTSARWVRRRSLSWAGIRHIEVAGPQGYSPLDIADAFAETVGRPIEAIAVPRGEWETLWVSQGMPEGRTAPRAEMVDGFNSGWIHFGVPGTEHVNGITPLREVITQLVTRG